MFRLNYVIYCQNLNLPYICIDIYVYINYCRLALQIHIEYRIWISYL